MIGLRQSSKLSCDRVHQDGGTGSYYALVLTYLPMKNLFSAGSSLLPLSPGRKVTSTHSSRGVLGPPGEENSAAVNLSTAS